MKMNQKLYNSITSEPFEVQTLENDARIELHSLDDNPDLYNQYAPNAKFAVWSCADGKNYRLLLEKTYYERLHELYGKRVNQCMVTFWDNVERDRGKLIKFFFIPVSVVAFLVFIVFMFFPRLLGETGQLIVMGVTLVGFIVANTILNKKIDSIIQKHNSESVEKIKNIIGHKHFNELMEETRAHYDDFFGIKEETKETEEGQEEPVETLEIAEEVVEDTKEETAE